MRGSECLDALALTVSLKLAPQVTLATAAAGMLSVDGRCKTLDARANGHSRSEGVGAVMLQPLRAHMSLRGSAVRQDGRSASLTAPNGSAQRILMLVVLGRATLVSSEILSIEMHESSGTGTALGDPTEVGALQAVYNLRSIWIGAAKANAGHSEAASGQVGLLKLWLGVKDVAAPGNARLRALNSLVRAKLDGAASNFVLHTQSSFIPCSNTSGISAFGFSDTVAHSVLAVDSSLALVRAKRWLPMRTTFE